MEKILNANTLSVVIFLMGVLFIGTILCVIRDNIVNEKKGLNPQIAMIVSLSVFAILVVTIVCRCIYLFSSFIITKILTEMTRGDMLWAIAGAIAIGIAMTVYWLVKIDDLSEKNEKYNQMYESDKNDELEPQEEEPAVETTEEPVVEEKENTDM